MVRAVITSEVRTSAILGGAGGGGEGSDLPDFRVIAGCVGRGVIPAGGVLVLKVCQLASEPTGLEKMSASVQ